jgi:hypothetical protein
MGAVNTPEAGTSGAASDPVVGWLVITKGPGLGKVLTLGYGRNAIGRGDKARINVDFGDAEISRGAHCIVYFEPREREFSVQHGDGVNMTYRDGKPLYEREVLESGTVIDIGATSLRFVPFCSKDWDWKNDAGV